MTDALWRPSFACPLCLGEVLAEGDAVRCPICHETYAYRGAIHRFLTRTRAEAVAGFLNQYRAVRRSDGHAVESLATFRELPEVAPHSAGAEEWRIRQQSFATFVRRVCGRSAAALRVLDLGAGCGWFSYRLAQLGASAVAVDLDDDDTVGLGVAARAGGGPCLVQADFDSLPFMPGQFDAVVLNASLHYASDPMRTLVAADRLLSPGGALVVMDSPMFVSGDDGARMAAEQLQAIARTCGIAGPHRPGVGFLTFDQLHDAARQLRRRARFVASDGPMAWRIRRFWAGQRQGRAPAAFGVWVAR